MPMTIEHRTERRRADPRKVGLALALSAALGGCGGSGGGGDPAPESGDDAATVQTNTAAEPSANAITDIQVLALASTDATAMYPDVGLRVQHLVNVANDVAASSGIGLEFTVAHLEMLDYANDYEAPKVLEDLTLATDAVFTEVAALRDAHEADLVVLFRPYVNDGYCGYAWLGGYQTEGDFSRPAEADYGYAVVSLDCSDYVLLHELGHNLGLAHSRREDPDGGSFSYGLGHGIDKEFVTIMASPAEFNAVRLPKLSSPLLDCNGQPCGIDHADTEQGADAVRALNIVKDQVADYR